MLQFHENQDTPTPRKTTCIPSATKGHMHGQKHSYRGSRTHNIMRHKSCVFHIVDLHNYREIHQNPLYSNSLSEVMDNHVSSWIGGHVEFHIPYGVKS